MGNADDGMSVTFQVNQPDKQMAQGFRFRQTGEDPEEEEEERGNLIKCLPIRYERIQPMRELIHPSNTDDSIYTQSH